jgi:hypothetical protein
MSTIVTTVRQSVVSHWLVSAIAATVLVAALATSLVLSFAGSSSGSSAPSAPTIGGSGTSLQDNSGCNATRSYALHGC